MRANLLDIRTRSDVRAIEQFAIDSLQISAAELMDRAARAALRELQTQWSALHCVGMLCGSGNNAGDGYVLARLLHEAGVLVHVGALSDPERLTAQARSAHRALLGAGVQVFAWREVLERPVDLWVDALLGIGADRELQGEFAAAVEALNSKREPIVALDIPSGLDADTGEILGTAVRASLTVTFIAHKAGLWLAEGPGCAGAVKLAALELEQWPELPATDLKMLAGAEFSHALRARRRNANKGDFGHVLIVGGGPGMAGAVQLSGEAALRSGAGLVTVAMSPDAAHHGLIAIPELMVRTPQDAAELMSFAQRADVIAIGPGLGQSSWARGMWSCVMASDRPLIVDADALNLLAAHPEQRAQWVLTPHPGEAARLLGIDTKEVQRDRRAAARELQRRYGGSVVLKGAGTLVAEGDGALGVCIQGNPGMAAPGMGDALTGVIASLAGQLGDLRMAARMGVWLHAVAGDQAARRGERGMMTRDLIDELRACVNQRSP